MLDDHTRSYLRREIERAVRPRGMSVHDGRVHVDASVIQRLLAIIEKLSAERDAMREALEQHSNPLNWSCDEQGIRRCWEEPGSSSPSAYNGFEAARTALAMGEGNE